MGYYMKIAICDDSLEDRKKVENLCKDSDFINNLECNLFSSGNELIKAIKNGIKFDIIFLDVDMPGVNGIEVGKLIHQIFPLCIIIFITSYSEYAVESYDCEAFHYFVKPFDTQKFYDVLKRALKRLGIIHQYHIVKSRGFPTKIAIHDIFYIEYSLKHVIYHLENDSIEVVDKLSNVYESLSQYGFLQIHQGYIVNMEKIQKITKTSVVLKDNRQIPMSLRKKQEVLLEYSTYISRYT